MMAGSTMLTTVPFCHESGSACFTSMYIAVHIGIVLIIFKEGTGYGFLWLTDMRRIEQTCSLCVNAMLMTLHPKCFVLYPLQYGGY
jgi:hypothetical protein